MTRRPTFMAHPRRHDAWRTLAEAVLFFGAVAVIVAAMSLAPV